MKELIILIITLFTFCNCSKETTNTTPTEIPTDIYFPDNNTDIWETENISDLGWNENQLEPLLSFLEEKNSKSFMILYNGKIVIEKYLNNHTSDTNWYWASAGKTLTTAMIGIAQEQGFLDINNKVSDYLGAGWTNTNLDKENLITCQNLLSMNSGLDDSLGDNVDTNNLVYTADAGTRWAYHNVYKKLQNIIENTTNNSWSNYFNTELRDKIGMSGSWINLNNYNLYWSDTRSMARFGLLIYADGKWDATQIISNTFLKETTSTSQSINLSYGYLWWLNGKESYHLPNSQVKFNGSLIPNAPDDMIAALGKNDQKIYIVPSKKIVIIRMGQAADEENFAVSNFDNELWEKINAFIN